MTAAAATLLADIRARGAWLTPEPDGTFSIKAPRGLLTEDLRSQLAEHKTDLLRLLRREAAGIPVMPEPDAAIMDAVLEAFDGMGMRCSRHGRRVDGKSQPPDPEDPPAPGTSEVQPPVPSKPPPGPPPLTVAEALEEARLVYLTRLGIAIDQNMPTELGSPAELIAWREAMEPILAGWPGPPGPSGL